MVVVCVYFLFCRVPSAVTKPPERESAFFAERNCNSSPNFSFFFKSHDWSLRKVFSYKGKASLRLVRAKQRHGVSASTKKYTVASLPLSSPVTTQ